MKLYDISQEVFSCAVYPGDPKPEYTRLSSTEAGDLYNLTAHFLGDGKTVEQLEPEIFVGACYVARREGDLTAADAREILAQSGGAERILIAGPVTVTLEAAQVFAGSGIRLLGNESQSVGPEDAPMAVHLALLGRGIALLEGVVLTDVPQGQYVLSAAPLKLAGADGSPCRAILIDMAQ